jgi:tRNA U55 pseudouridine synthase TruB
MVELRRTTSKYLDLKSAITFEEVESKIEQQLIDPVEKSDYIQSLLLKPDELLKSLPKILVNKETAIDVSHGRKGMFDLSQVSDVFPSDQHFRVYQALDPDQDLDARHFLGIAEITPDNQLKVRRLFNSVLL